MRVLLASGWLLGFLTGLAFVLDPVVEAGGRLSAHLDLALGQHRYLPFGHGSPLSPYWDRVMQERYSVEVRHNWGEPFFGMLPVWSGLEVSLGRYAEGYNAVSEQAVNRKLAKDVFTAAIYEAAAEYQAHPPPPR